MRNIQAYTLRIVQNDGRKRTKTGVTRCTLTVRNVSGHSEQINLNTKQGQEHLNAALDVLGKSLDEAADTSA